MSYLRIPGHKLTITWSGERSRDEQSSTGDCICGWSESCSIQDVVRQEYRWHLQSVKRRLDAQAQQV